jgi:hypothetical protein
MIYVCIDIHCMHMYKIYIYIYSIYICVCRCINTRMYVHVCTILFLMSCSSPRGFHSPAIKGNPFAWGQGLEDQVSLNWYGMAQVTFQTGSRKATASNPWTCHRSCWESSGYWQILTSSFFETLLATGTISCSSPAFASFSPSQPFPICHSFETRLYVWTNDGMVWV